MDAQIIQKIAISAIPVIFAITLHEAAHGYAALRFGDRTAWMLGRISLDPRKHIDPIGTLLMPALLLMLSSGSILFGYAKPVPVNFSQLRRPKQDMLWVAAAGPAANLVMALGWAGLLKLSIVMPEFVYTEAVREMARAGIGINVSLMVLNLLPLPPLDGGRIMVSVLPISLANSFSRIEPYGMYILFAMLYFRILDLLMIPPMRFCLSLLSSIFAF